jgi:hypothetical protein
VGLEGEIHVRVYLLVFEVVGAGRDYLLDLLPRRLEVGVYRDQVFPHHGAQLSVVFRFEMLAAMAKQSAHHVSSFPEELATV